MGVVIVEREGAVLGVNLGRPIVTNWDGDTPFQITLEEDVFLFLGQCGRLSNWLLRDLSIALHYHVVSPTVPITQEI